MQEKTFIPPKTIPELLARLEKPEACVITAGMPYANGPVHLGHLVGALIPPDIMARYMRMMIGHDNVLFVSGTDDHGSTSEVSAQKAGRPVREFIDEIHAKQQETLKNYGLSLNIYTGTSRPETFPIHKELCQEFFRRWHKNKMLQKKTTKQWFDVSLKRFLQDRNVTGKCPNPQCTNTQAYSDECEVCGMRYEPSQLLSPVSSLSQTQPELRDTVHWWLDLGKVSDELTAWIKTKQNKWRKVVFNEVFETVRPALQFENRFEETYKALKAQLPAHKSRYAAGKKVVLQFEAKAEFTQAQTQLSQAAIPTEALDGWALRSITRDVLWGIPLPIDLDPEMAQKTLYVWPDSLIAPLSFSQVALKAQGRSPEEYRKFWCNPKGRIFQFLGQDNIYFYVLMQGAMWLGQQTNLHQLPGPTDYQMSDVLSVFHLMVNGEKMSKSRGNFYSADQLIHEMGYDADQVRYFLATLGLAEKPSNFEFSTFHERNKFLAGPMNAAFEKPLSAAHSRFEGQVPAGELLEKVQQETFKIVQLYLKNMEKSEHITLLGQIENYARLINSLFVQYKPHDDRADLKGRQDALYSCFYILKNLLIMLHPFVPQTMERVRECLQLPPTVFRLEELGTGLPAGHKVLEKQAFFPAVP
jgi:methionyl-tRNA synthetase